MKYGNVFLTAGACILLASCALLNPGAPPTHYRLSAPVPVVEPGGQVDWSLGIEAPQGSAMLETPRIAVRPARHEVAYYAGVRWIETPPRLVRDLMLMAFEDTGKIPGVAQGGGAIAPDYTLAGHLRAFEAIVPVDGVIPEVHIHLVLTLYDRLRGRVVASREFEARRQAVSPGTDDVVAAFQEVSQAIIAEGVVWTLTVGEKDYSGN